MIDKCFLFYFILNFIWRKYPGLALREGYLCPAGYLLLASSKTLQRSLGNFQSYLFETSRPRYTMAGG